MDTVTPYKKSGMIKAAIDIGTNSVLLLVAELEENRILPLAEKQSIPRLGKGVDRDKNLNPASQQRVTDVLKEYRNYLMKNYPECGSSTTVTATSAVRDASNRKDFLKKVFMETGWKVRILSGEEEAQITFNGALAVLKEKPEINNIILDIGGGSTEIAYGEDELLKFHTSIDMGSVRFSERFLTSNPPSVKQIRECENEIDRLLKRETIPDDDFRIVGVAGTVTSVAAIDAGFTSYKPEKINGYRLSKYRIEEFIKEFSEISSEKIEINYPHFLKGRGDVILAGLLILQRFLAWRGKEYIVVSTGGIRHGLLLTDY